MTGHLWKVARVDAARCTAEQRQELIAWVAEVSGLLSEAGVAAYVRPTIVVSQDDRDRSYRLHITKYVLVDGNKVIDHAAGELHTEPLVFPIIDFPAWLPAVSHQQKIGDS